MMINAIDQFWRKHPFLFAGWVMILVVLTTILYLFQGESTGILYEAF